VVSSFSGGFENTQAGVFTDFYKAYNLAQNKAMASRAANISNSTTAVNASLLAAVPADLQAKLDHMNKQIAVLQAIAIAGVCFGVLGLALGIFGACRIFVHSTLWGGMGSGGMVHPSSLGTDKIGGSVRRQKSTGNLSEASMHGPDALAI
jgi:hypothetical protein